MVSRRLRELHARDRKRSQRLTVLTVLLVMSLILAAGFYLGQTAAHSGMGIDPQDYRRMQVELPTLQAKLDESLAALDVEQTRREVDRASLEMLRSDIASRRDHIAALEEELAFYRGLMTPSASSEVLTVRTPELVALGLQGHFAYQILVQQEARKHPLLKGELRAEVVGTLRDLEVSYPLSELSEQLADVSVPLRFRYFQAIEGELVLPEGFTPQYISVVARATAPRKTKVSKQFPWQLRERLTHVGK
tara:strand:- start:5777 stop:6523 length:747 start_codon:yes stop_codon:yes gene_type:complete